MPVKNEERSGSTTAPEMIEKSKFDELQADYEKLVRAFNKLLKEYNDLHINQLLSDR